MTALIIDDEFQSRKLIAKMLSIYFPVVNVLGEAGTLQEALQLIQIRQPQLIFLDIQLQQGNGFDMLDKLGDHNFEIIFITAHYEFAVKAFRYSALDYLMKPVDVNEFQCAVNKAIARVEKNRNITKEKLNLLKQQLNSAKLPERVVVPCAEGYFIIPVCEIMYCQANSNYTEFQLVNNKKITSSYTLGYFEEVLGVHHFFRVHRSFIVNLACIKMYKKGEGGTVVMQNDFEIEVSRSNKDAFIRLLKNA